MARSFRQLTFLLIIPVWMAVSRPRRRKRLAAPPWIDKITLMVMEQKPVHERKLHPVLQAAEVVSEAAVRGTTGSEKG